MKPSLVINQLPAKDRSSDCRRIRARRSGVLTVFALLMLVIAIGMLMLVLNYVWLVLHNRDMQRRSDLLALVSIEELLDEHLLADQIANQIDDAIEAEEAVHAFRRENNLTAANSLYLDASNVTVVPGRVDDVNQPVFVRQMPFNALRVELHRYAEGPNPARLLIRGFGTPDAADVTTASVATLDSFVVGFRPTVTMATPLAAVAISASAWFTNRRQSKIDTNANNRFELDVLLRPLSGGGIANGAVIGVDRSIPLDLGMIPDQIVGGILPGDLAGGLLGPATPGNPLPLPASDISPDSTDALVAALNSVAASDDPRRIFAIYSGNFTDPLQIVGFIAATVLEAENVGQSDEQLRVTVEPVFIVHPTAVTVAADPSVPENVYIHKLRLVQ